MTTLLSVCSDMQFSLASLVGMQMINDKGFVCLECTKRHFRSPRPTVVCVSLDLKQVDYASAGPINLGAG